jgi:hypothetical protein
MMILLGTPGVCNRVEFQIKQKDTKNTKNGYCQGQILKSWHNIAILIEYH